MTLQLVDGLIKHPKGIVEDLLVQVDKFTVPLDFVVLEMKGAPLKYKEHIILLGRPFMATTKTIIDVHSGKLTIIVLGETIQLQAIDSMPYPSFQGKNGADLEAVHSKAKWKKRWRRQWKRKG